MKVLSVVGSPRKGGNTDILVDEVLRGARETGGEVEKIFLNDLEIKPCQAECSDVSASDPLVGMLIRSLDYLEVEFHAKQLVFAGEKGAVKQNVEEMSQAYKIGMSLK